MKTESKEKELFKFESQKLKMTKVICFSIISLIVLTGVFFYFENNKNYLRVAQTMYPSDFSIISAIALDQTKEIEIECSQDAIKGDSLIKGQKSEKQLKKVNPECVEEYEYKTYKNPVSYPQESASQMIQIETFAKLKDIGCSGYKLMGNYTFFRCPKRNCKKIEVTKKIDEYVVDYFKLQEIGALNCKLRLVLK